MDSKQFILLAVRVVAYVVMHFTSIEAADVVVGTSIPPAQQIPLSHVDHSAWDQLLKKHVDEKGMVSYAAWKSSANDLKSLDQYLNLLSHSNGQGSRDEQLAFWINAYNAVTVKGILREYPTSSIRNHTATLIGYNIWKNLKLVVGGKLFSLEDIEHQVLRKMSEPRIHFAIVCASIGCPRLLNEAYLPDRLDHQLTANAKSFFADQSKFRFDASRNIFYVSPILDWFGEDFGSTAGSRLQKIAAWLPNTSSQQAAASGSGKLSFVDYDWGLNDRK
jgi:hypothetical protein